MMPPHVEIVFKELFGELKAAKQQHGLHPVWMTPA